MVQKRKIFFHVDFISNRFGKLLVQHKCEHTIEFFKRIIVFQHANVVFEKCLSNIRVGTHL